MRGPKSPGGELGGGRHCIGPPKCGGLGGMRPKCDEAAAAAAKRPG